MPWSSSNRRNELPGDWPTRRLARFELDYWTCVDCGLSDPTGRLLECDHIGRPDDHRLDMLRTRCADISKGGNGCHRKRTTTQAAQARSNQPKTTRPPERHPGLA